MSNKILTVDDSKAIRIIVKKAFKAHDVNISEAQDGVQGLEVAAKERPDLILLDVTMPNMDGIEMLTKLKSDPDLKKTPVIMLTAEGGKDTVMKIAKIGIRDYIVKPFDEKTIIEKVNRVLNLKPKITAQTNNSKSITDTLSILVVDDKPNIVQQIQSAVQQMPWTISSCNSTDDALDFFSSDTPPDLVITSLTLPNEQAFSFLPSLRKLPNAKDTPVFGLVIKTDELAQQKARQSGFSDFFTKPIDPNAITDPIIAALKLDISSKFFIPDTNHLLIQFPENPSPSLLKIFSSQLNPQISNAVEMGLNRIIFNIQAIDDIDIDVIKLLINATDTCKTLTLNFAFVASPITITQCKTTYEETESWPFFESLNEASSAPPEALQLA